MCFSCCTSRKSPTLAESAAGRLAGLNVSLRELNQSSEALATQPAEVARARRCRRATAAPRGGGLALCCGFECARQCCLPAARAHSERNFWPRAQSNCLVQRCALSVAVRIGSLAARARRRAASAAGSRSNIYSCCLSLWPTNKSNGGQPPAAPWLWPPKQSSYRC